MGRVCVGRVCVCAWAACACAMCACTFARAACACAWAACACMGRVCTGHVCMHVCTGRVCVGHVCMHVCAGCVCVCRVCVCMGCVCMHGPRVRGPRMHARLRGLRVHGLRVRVSVSVPGWPVPFKFSTQCLAVPVILQNLSDALSRNGLNNFGFSNCRNRGVVSAHSPRSSGQDPAPRWSLSCVRAEMLLLPSPEPLGTCSAK